uniref:NCK-associated protein 5-like n=1 Tax=Gasterosteus aculeatus aculeatus TaxID=481459 RepID=G3PCS6_GASAC
MRTMSDETEQRMCDEDFGSDEEGEEGDVESFLEDNSSELVDRLRELEAENSALMLANESQREAYERCLDEVANHVVQALLNQKDLREECIKLKMLVFDLERQNRSLCELFQHKLPNHPTAHYQVNPPLSSVAELQCTAGNGYRTQHASPGPRGSAASMEALSPFFKKKAHILEVLRKMEETDPLKFHPSTASLSFCDYSQVLMSTEAVLATADPPCKSHHSHCNYSCPDADSHQRVNGDGAVKCEGGNACCLHCKRSPDSPPKPCNHVCTPSKAHPATQSHAAPAAATSECHSKSRAAESAPPSKRCNKNEAHQPPAGAAAAQSSVTETADRSLEGMEAEQETESSESCPNGSVSEELTGFCPASQLPGSATESSQISHCDAGTSGGVRNGVRPAISNEPSPVPDKDCADQGASSARASASVSPSTSCLTDVKAAAINSPSKLLKFLKIPTIGEKAQPSTPAVRLSPQLTRSSRIPCRTNNYESAAGSPLRRPRGPSPTPPRTRRRPRLLSPTTSPPRPPRTRATPASRHLKPVLLQIQELLPPLPLPPPPPHPKYLRGSLITKMSDSSSIPKRPAAAAAAAPARPPADSSHHAFKDRLAALGKLRSSEDLQVGLRPVEAVNEFVEERRKEPMELPKEEQRHSKYTDAVDGKPRLSGGGLKYPGSSQLYEHAVKSAGSVAVKQELCVTKTEGSKSKIGLPSPNADAPQVLRNNIKCPASLNLAYNLKPGVGPHSSNSPNKIPPKSPSKPCQGASIHRGGKPAEAPRYSSKSEERTKISGKGKKNPMYGDSLPPPPPRPPVSEGEEKPPPPPVPSPQSAIEQKVMKGIEENMLKLQEQDRGAQCSEVKQKASNGIASWFGLKKSKLPALSRKTDGAKTKDEKKEWKINIPSVSRDSAKTAGKCKEGVEGLNISSLMEKAEGLRRALEEERAYVERSGRGHSCEVVMDPAQGQLAVMYRGGRSDNFMQQLLNRDDFWYIHSILLLCCFFMKGSERIGKITSDENLADSVHSQHFAGKSLSSTYTLDSGIGTFPLPDCSSGAAGRSLSKTRAGAERHSSGSPGRAGRRARTLDREPTPQDECYVPHKQLIPTIQYGSVLEGRSPGMKAGGPSPRPAGDPGSLPVPAQSGIRRGKTRTPSVPEMSREAGLELLRERPEEALSPSRPQVLETPESLSDSLYDSLSSCGSQG